jgi:hypothetical protein
MRVYLRKRHSSRGSLKPHCQSTYTQDVERCSFVDSCARLNSLSLSLSLSCSLRPVSYSFCTAFHQFSYLPHEQTSAFSLFPGHRVSSFILAYSDLHSNLSTGGCSPRSYHQLQILLPAHHHRSSLMIRGASKTSNQKDITRLPSPPLSIKNGSRE